MTELINLVIDRAILFDISIARRDIGLRLVVIIVGNEVFYCIIGEELLELTIKLPGQRFIMCNNQSRLVDLSNNLTHGIGLTSTRRPHENLGLLAPINIIHQLLDSLRLVTRWLVLRHQFKFIICNSVNHLLFLKLCFYHFTIFGSFSLPLALL